MSIGLMKHCFAPVAGLYVQKDPPPSVSDCAATSTSRLTSSQQTSSGRFCAPGKSAAWWIGWPLSGSYVQMPCELYWPV